MLIKDPYLNSHHKEIDIRSQPPLQQANNISAPSHSLHSQPPRIRAFSGTDVNELKGKVHAYAK